MTVEHIGNRECCLHGYYMFQFFFKYPRLVFARGELVLLSSWPRWLLALLVLLAAGALAALIRARLPQAAPSVRNWRAGVIWLLQSCLAALLLILLWQPALVIAQLEPQKNIIAVVVDDSRSMATTEDGATRLERAVKVMQGGVLAGLQKQFQTRFYRLDREATRVSSLEELQASTPVTHIGAGLKQLAEETSDLPIGAVVLLSDGSDNSGGIDLDTITALRSRRIPVHTVGFGRLAMAQDVEIDDATVAPRALADSRLAAMVRFHQHGYAGRKATLRVHDGATVLAAREITLSADGAVQTENLMFNAGRAGAKALRFSVDLLPGEENPSNNAVTRLVNVESGRRRVLYVEGEPRWEYKFIRRAESDDPIVQLVSMLRTTENKIYRQGIDDPNELAQGFPATAEELFAYQGLIIGSVEADYFTPAQRDLIEQFVDRRGGGLLLLGGRLALADGGWSASGLADLLPVASARPQGYIPPRQRHRRLDARGRRQHHLPIGRRPGAQPGALEETALPRGLSGLRHAQARRGSIGGNERRGTKGAAAGHRELWPRTNRHPGHGRDVALADGSALRMTIRTTPSGSNCCAGSLRTRRATWSPPSASHTV